MDNQPDRQPEAQTPPAPPDKLVLPAPPEQEPDGQTYASPTRPEPLLRRASSPMSRGIFAPIRLFWRQDPAFRVLGLTIALVSVASLILVALGADMLLHSTSPRSNRGQAAAPVPATTAPTQASALTVDIISIPNTVENGATIPVQVQTSEPGASVKLQVTSRFSSFFSTSSPQVTDAAGRAIINWFVTSSSFRGKTKGNTHATVTVVATDQNGQQATSDPVTVTITGSHQGNNDD